MSVSAKFAMQRRMVLFGLLVAIVPIFAAPEPAAFKPTPTLKRKAVEARATGALDKRCTSCGEYACCTSSQTCYQSYGIGMCIDDYLMPLVSEYLTDTSYAMPTSLSYDWDALSSHLASRTSVASATDAAAYTGFSLSGFGNNPTAVQGNSAADATGTLGSGASAAAAAKDKGSGFSSWSTGAKVGVIVGPIAAVAIIAGFVTIIVCMSCKKKRKNVSHQGAYAQPPMQGPTPSGTPAPPPAHTSMYMPPKSDTIVKQNPMPSPPEGYDQQTAYTQQQQYQNGFQPAPAYSPPPQQGHMYQPPTMAPGVIPEPDVAEKPADAILPGPKWDQGQYYTPEHGPIHEAPQQGRH